VEGGQAGALDRGDMDEYVFAAALGLNESITLRRVEPLHGAGSHHGLLVCTNLIAAARPSCDRSFAVSVAYGKAHREARDKQGHARLSGGYAVLASGSTAWVIENHRSTPLHTGTARAPGHGSLGHTT